MKPGEFNQRLAGLVSALYAEGESQVKLSAICGFLCETREKFDLREHWAQKAKLLFHGESAPQLRSLFDVDRLLNFLPDQLAFLSSCLSEIENETGSLGDFAQKVRAARVLQYLYVGNASGAAELLGIAPPRRFKNTLDSARYLAAHVEDEQMSTHLAPFLTQWRRLSKTRRLSLSSVHVLLLCPAQPGWQAHGVLTTLELEQITSEESGHLIALPENAAAASRKWLERKGVHDGFRRSKVRIADVSLGVTGSSHSLAIAALIAAQAEDEIESWKRVGFSPLHAVSGEVDGEGWVQAVDSLDLKLTRAFYSPIEVVAVPAVQRDDARRIVEELERKEPHRRLRVLPVWSISDILDPPVQGVRRRVAPLKLVQRKSSVIARIALLMASLMILATALQVVVSVNPKLSPWFDWQPVFWDVRDGNHVVLYNRQRQQISSLALQPSWRVDAVSHPVYSNLVNADSTLTYSADSLFGHLPFWSEAARYCQLADIDGDGQLEVFFQSRYVVDTDTLWKGTIFYCLAKSNKLLWFRDDYEVYWKRTFDYESLKPLTGSDAPTEVEPWGMTAVDWRSDGHANLVLSMHSASRKNNGAAYLEELDGRTGMTLGRFWHSQWFFAICAVKSIKDESQTVWAGSYNAQHSAPELFIFRDNIKNQVWPCADTTGMRVLRYPYSDVALAFEVPTLPKRIYQSDERRSQIAINMGSNQHQVGNHEDWRGFVFYVDHDARWFGESFDLSYMPHLRKFERDGNITLPDDMQEWITPLTYAEQWTGKEWIPADTTRPKPDPYPIYESTDPRLSKPIKLPVKWQDLKQ